MRSTGIVLIFDVSPKSGLDILEEVLSADRSGKLIYYTSAALCCQYEMQSVRQTITRAADKVE